MSTACSPLNSIACLFSAPFIASWSFGSSSVTKRASNDQRFGSLGDKISVVKLSRVRNANSKLLGGKFVLLL